MGPDAMIFVFWPKLNKCTLKKTTTSFEFCLLKSSFQSSLAVEIWLSFHNNCLDTWLPVAAMRTTPWELPAAATKSLQSCPTLCSPPGSPSLGFSRQEHWSGVPLPSPWELPTAGNWLPEEPTNRACSDRHSLMPPRGRHIRRAVVLRVSGCFSPDFVVWEQLNLEMCYETRDN